jgi:hypothetical protein
MGFFIKETDVVVVLVFFGPLGWAHVEHAWEWICSVYFTPGQTLLQQSDLTTCLHVSPGPRRPGSASHLRAAGGHVVTVVLLVRYRLPLAWIDGI